MNAVEPVPGDLLGPLEVGAVAHGGHCVARHEGRVVFVRHTLPGELVTVRLTDTQHASYWSADAVQVHRGSPDRIDAACPVSGPGGCGGCDFQHVAPTHQRELKRRVVAEQLERLAGIDWDGTVEEVDLENGPGWRTRMRYFADGNGGWGLRRHHSHEVVPLPDEGCRIAAVETPSGSGQVVDLVRDADGVTTVIIDGELVDGEEVDELGVGEVVQRAAGREFRVAADGFWQVHPGAADTLVAAVLAGLEPAPGERAFDLYCGVGLFAGALVDAGAAVWGIEGSRSAIRLARRNVPEARFRAGRVDRVIRELPQRTDLVVLDPPRKGAGKAVMVAVLDRRPRRIAYVACDPAALGRDLGTASRAGWRVVSVRAFDLFPMTHHVECVAILERP